MGQGKGRRARPHSLTENGVESKILESRVQRLFDDRIQAMDLIDEEDVSRGQVEKDRAERALVVDRGPGADLDRDAELVGDDVRERCLAETRRAAQQHVLDGLVPATRRLEKDAEVLPHLLLTHVLAEEPGAQREVELGVVGLRVEEFVLGHFRPSD